MGISILSFKSFIIELLKPEQEVRSCERLVA